MTILISCETGGQGVPATLQTEPSDRRVWRQLVEQSLIGDAAARRATRQMVAAAEAESVCQLYSPQLIDVSRSLRHRELFSPLSRRLSESLRKRLTETIYDPYRQEMKRRIAAMLRQTGRCLHVSVRTFDSCRDGTPRRADVGLAYDTSRPAEVQFCSDWSDDLYDQVTMLKVRRNYPRRGPANNLISTMRQEFDGEDYIGIELQLNRAWAARDVAVRDEALLGIADSLDYLAQDSLAEVA